MFINSKEMKKNIANERLERLKKSLVTKNNETYNGIDGTSQSKNAVINRIEHSMSSSAGHSSVSAASRKRKIEVEPNDETKRFRSCDSSPKNSSPLVTSNNLDNEKSFKRFNIHDICEIKHSFNSAKVARISESSRFCDENIKSLLKASTSAMTTPTFALNESQRSISVTVPKLSSDQGRKNIANERLKKIRNSIEICETNINSVTAILPNSYATSVTTISPNSYITSNNPKLRNNELKLENHVKSYSKTWDPNLFSCVDDIASKNISVGDKNSTSSNVSTSFNNIDNVNRHETIVAAPIIRESTSANSNKSPLTVPDTCKDLHSHDKSDDICIVVDTNIFLGHLKIVRGIINMPLSGSIKPVIYIPWMVFTELDYMKGDESLGKNARKAIFYINSLLQAGNCRIKGQTVFEANEQLPCGKDPDDKIVSCCLQVAQQYSTLILLSNDMNARNKALVMGISTCSCNEIIMKLHGFLTKNKKFQKIIHKMNIVCSYVICECAKETYGDVWNRMDLLKDRPWSLRDCLKIFTKYWIPLFSDKVLKHFQQAVEDLSNLLEHKSGITDDTDDFKDFANISAAMCYLLKDIECVRSIMEKTVEEIKKIRNS